MIIGGAERRKKDGETLLRFMSLANRCDPVVLVISAASRSPGRMSRSYEKLFDDMGARSVLCPLLQSSGDADCIETVEAAERADLLFITGGDQSRLTKILCGSECLNRLHHRHELGLLSVAGTSAGAAALSKIMISGGTSGFLPRKGVVRLSTGLAFASRIVIDQHFANRARFGRLLEAMIRIDDPRLMGVGVDEDTGIIIGPDGSAEVVGSGSVSLVAVNGEASCVWQRTKAGGVIPVESALFRILVPGQRISKLVDSDWHDKIVGTHGGVVMENT